MGASIGVVNGVRAAAYTLISINKKAWQKHVENPCKDRTYSKIGKWEGEFQLAIQQKVEETVSYSAAFGMWDRVMNACTSERKQINKYNLFKVKKHVFY